MLLHQYNTASYLDGKIKDFWIMFKSDILKLTTKSWKEEDNAGSSYSQWKVMQYYNVLSLVILIYLDVQKNQTIYTDWSYYNTKYDLDAKRKCLACECIDLDKVLELFGFPFNNGLPEIEGFNIENTFIIEGSICDTSDEIPADARMTEDNILRDLETTDFRIIE